jgi:hypothetical protein
MAHTAFDYWLSTFVGTVDEARDLFCNDSDVQLIEAVAQARLQLAPFRSAA